MLGCNDNRLRQPLHDAELGREREEMKISRRCRLDKKTAVVMRVMGRITLNIDRAMDKFGPPQKFDKMGHRVG